MKSATIPSVRVEPELRSEVESLLEEGETLSEFVESSVREAVQRRRQRAEFLARGRAALDKAKRSGEVVEAGTVVARLESMLQAAREGKTRRGGR
jgi:Arc/MetJ-type ribon-helix-helix transcriptional regulator